MPFADGAPFAAGSPGLLPEAPGACVVELHPHRSLNPRGARRVVASVAAGTFAVAIYCTVYGYWPVLVFAVLEILALIWALGCSIRSGMISETIAVTTETVTVTHRERGNDRQAVFPRHWARVTLHAPLAALHPSRLLIESHGRACEVGRFLTEDERRNLAVRLKQLVGNVNESPAL